MHQIRLSVLTAVVLLTAIHSYAQGSLTPTGGPTPVFKTLQQLEPRTPIGSIPFTISESGSYYLTGNLVATGGFAGNGITIDADDVTIDLNGFALVGAPGSMNGIGLGSSSRNIHISNGIIKQWAGIGVDLSSAVGFSCERLIVDENDGGIKGGANGSIRISILTSNRMYGIQADEGCAIADTIVTGSSLGPGIVARNDCAITHAVAAQNATVGISASNHCSIIESVAYQNHTGFSIDDNSRLVHSVASRDAERSVVVGDNSVVRQNVCVPDIGFQPSEAAEYGILVEGSGNRIEENLISDSMTAVRVEQGGNIIVKNMSAFNLVEHFDVAAGNRLGPVDADLSAELTNHPWANFELYDFVP